MTLSSFILKKNKTRQGQIIFSGPKYCLYLTQSAWDSNKAKYCNVIKHSSHYISQFLYLGILNKIKIIMWLIQKISKLLLEQLLA